MESGMYIQSWRELELDNRWVNDFLDHIWFCESGCQLMGVNLGREVT